MGTSGPGKVNGGGAEGNINTLMQMGQKLFKQSGPVRKELFAQVLEALKTGGVGAQIPVIQRAVENSRAASGQALQQTSDQLAGANLSGTPYGQSILAQGRIAGNLASANIPTDIAQQFIGMGPGLATTTAQQGLGAVQSATSLNLQRQEFNAEQFASFMKDVKQSVQSLFGAGMGASGSPGGTGFSPQMSSYSADTTYADAPGVSDTSAAWDRVKSAFGSGQSPYTAGY